MLYEPADDLKSKDAGDAVRPGVMQSIVDNVVKQPKSYSLEVIIPFQPIGRYIAEGVQVAEDMISNIINLFGEDAGNVAHGIFSGLTMGLKYLNQAAQIVGKLPGMQGVSTINKNSLEAMAESGMLLTMKMWSGYDYKYVVIKGLSSEKQPLEDDVFRGTIQVQEMPVLNISKPKDATDTAKISRDGVGGALVTAITAVQSSLIAPIIWLTDIKTAANETTNALGVTKAALGV
jgi:hypothetical protein